MRLEADLELIARIGDEDNWKKEKTCSIKIPVQH